MKVLINKYDRYPRRIICTTCRSVLEIEKEDIQFQGQSRSFSYNYGNCGECGTETTRQEYVDCPLCHHQIILSEKTTGSPNGPMQIGLQF